MWIIVLLPIACIVGYFVYLKVILPKMNAQSEEKQKAFTSNFISQVSGREDEVRSQYVKTNGSVKRIAKQMDADAIEGIVSCMEKRDLKDVAKQALTNVAGNIVGKFVGVGFKQTDNEEAYYLALTSDKLHYVHFSESGECREHLSFDRNQMRNLETGKVTSTEAMTVQADMFGTFRLSFEYEGTPYKFFYLDRCYIHPAAEEVPNEEKEFAELNYLFAEPFLKFAATVWRES